MKVLTSGEQALRFVRESAQNAGEPDAGVVLLDLRMPVNDGLVVLRAIREAAATSNWNVAVLTGGFISRRERADLLRFDVRSILVKPSNLDGYATLGAEVFRFCREHRSNAVA